MPPFFSRWSILIVFSLLTFPSTGKSQVDKSGLYYPDLAEAMAVSLEEKKPMVVLLGCGNPNCNQEAKALELIMENQDTLGNGLVLTSSVDLRDSVLTEQASEKTQERLRAIASAPTLCLFLPLKDDFSFVGHSEAGAEKCLEFIKTAGERAENHERLLVSTTALMVNKMDANVRETDSGLQYKMVLEGDGPKPGPKDTVVFHYEVRLWNDDTVIDSSYERGEPLTIEMKSTISGLAEGIQLMSPGGRATFTIPPEIAYGENGSGKIPGNSVVVYEVNLLSVQVPERTEPPAPRPELKEVPGFFYRSLSDGMVSSHVQQKPLLVMMGCGRPLCSNEERTYNMLMEQRAVVEDEVIMTVAVAWDRTENDILLSQVSEASLKQIKSINDVPVLCLFVPASSGFHFVDFSESGAENCLSFLKETKQRVQRYNDALDLQRIFDNLREGSDSE